MTQASSIRSLLLLCTLLGACAHLPPAGIDSHSRGMRSVQRPCDADCRLGQLVVSAAAFRAMTPAELAAQAEALRRNWTQEKSEESRLLYASFLALAPSPYSDRARALTLLDVESSTSNGRGRSHPLAMILIPLLHEPRRQDSEVAALQQRLREETRRADGLQQTSEALQRKLEALREIERGMLERPARKP